MPVLNVSSFSTKLDLNILNIFSMIAIPELACFKTIFTLFWKEMGSDAL